MKQEVGSLKPEGKRKRHLKLWIGIGLLILLAPIGLILPELLKSGGAWGEWGADELERIAGYVPEGFKKLSGIWKAPLSGYVFSGLSEGKKQYMGYILSAITGVALVAGIAILIGKILSRKNDDS